MLVKWKVSAVMGVLALALGLASSLLLVRDTKASPVEVREEGTVVSLAEADDALEAVSKRVGFEVRAPGVLPQGVRLVFVDSTLGPIGSPRPMPIAFLVYSSELGAKGPATLLRVEQTGVRFADPQGHGEKLDLSVVGVSAYSEPTAGGSAYTVLSADRGFLVLVAGSDAADSKAILPVLRSLVE